MPPRLRNPLRDEDIMEAITYVNAVKRAFGLEKEKYQIFLETLSDFKAETISEDVVKTRVRELFVDHQELIVGFNAFIPEGREIIPTDDNVENQSRTTESQRIHNFMNKLKERFQDDDDVYKSFMGVLNRRKIEQKDLTKVAAVFEGHPDLAEEFRRISSDGASTSRTKTLSDKEADFWLFASVLNETDESRSK